MSTYIYMHCMLRNSFVCAFVRLLGVSLFLLCMCCSHMYSFVRFVRSFMRFAFSFALFVRLLVVRSCARCLFASLLFGCGVWSFARPSCARICLLVC